MNKINEMFKDKKLYLFGVITLIFFGVFISIQYAPDTYTVFSERTKASVTHFFSCGRLITGCAVGITKGILNLTDNIIYNLSYMFAIICTILSLYKLYNLINVDIKNKTVSVILSSLVVINVFSLELFVYIEKGIMMLSVLMSILAVEQTKEFLENKKWKSMILALIFMIIATSSYQGTVGIFVAISLIYILKYSKTIKEFLLNNVKVALIYGIPAGINFVMVRFMGTNSRVEGNIRLAESIEKIVSGVKNLIINTYGLFPKYCFALAMLVAISFGIYKFVRHKNGNAREKIVKILAIIYILAGTLFATVAPQILQNTDSIWFVARSSYPMASVIGILLIYILSNCEVEKVEKNIIITCSCIYMLVQLAYFMIFAIDGYIVNYEDKQQTMELINLINEYEEETGNKITKIAIYSDKYITYTYPDTRASGDINVKAFSSDWAAKAIVNYYLGRQLEKVEISTTLEQYYKENDWQEFNIEQVKFEDDTIHLCLY